MDFHFLFYREMRGRTEAEFAKRQEKMGKNMVEQDLRVTKKSLYETVADRIEDMILDNSLQQGERLPSEQELATRFGISRNVMRESLKLLKERQLIMQKNGDGTYIAKPENDSVTEVLNRMLRLNDIGYMDIFEMRSLLEPYACRLVASRENIPDLEKLDFYIQEMVKTENIWDMRADYDILFHVQIAEWTGNPLLVCFIKSMVDLWKTILVRGIQIQQVGHQDGIEFHKRILDCLRARDPQAAEETMRAHIEKSKRLCWVE